MYVYIRAKYEMLWTVGFYDPKGEWHPESDHETSKEAAKRVAFLNGHNATDTSDASRDTH